MVNIPDIDTPWGSLDTGGLLTGIIAILILIVFWRKGMLKEGRSSKRGLFFYLFLVAGAIGLWITVRWVLLLANQLISPEVGFYSFTVYRVFDIVGSVLVTNICFSLMNKIGLVHKTRKAKISDWLKTATQAIIIGIITFTPRYGSTELLTTIGGYSGFVSILLVFCITLIVLVFALYFQLKVEP